MTAATLSAWVLSVLVWHSPPEKAAARPTHPEARETAAERLERYHGIADAIAIVVTEDVEPSYQRRAAALLLGVSWFESGWRRDVDLGIGKRAKGGGKDVCLMQIRSSDPRLTEDREHCFRTGLRMVRRSMNACRQLPLADRLAVYAAGRCTSEAGRRASRVRMQLADTFAGYRAQKD